MKILKKIYVFETVEDGPNIAVTLWSESDISLAAIDKQGNILKEPIDLVDWEIPQFFNAVKQLKWEEFNFETDA